MQTETTAMDFHFFSSIAALIALSMAAYLFIIRVILGCNPKNWNNSPPGPVGWPIVGSLPHLTKPLHEHFFKLSKIYGPLFSLKLGFKPVIVVSSPEMACKILQQHEAAFSAHAVNEAFRIITYDAMSVTASPMGSRWRLMRKILTEEVFSSQALKAFESFRNQQVHGLLKQLYSSSSMSTSPVRIGEWAFIALANLVSHIVCSKSLFDRTETGRELKETFGELINILGMVNIADIIPILKPLDPQGVRRRTLNIFSRYDAFYAKLIDERLEERKMSMKTSSNKEKMDILDVLLAYRGDREDEFTTIPRNIIKAILFDMYLAGTVTSSSTTEWGMTEILRNGDVYKKIVMELDQVVGKKRFVEESDISNLPYLQAAVKEVFRLHPAAPLIHRHANVEACEVSGFHIPKDCIAFVNVWGIGRDPSIWEEPCEFKPERFVGSSIDVKGRYFNLIPFGSGRRICVGWPLAHRIVHFYLASLLHAFEWECSAKILGNMEERVGLTIQKEKSLIAIPKPRLPTFVYL